MRAYLIAIDTGGTFTDCLATDSDGQTHRRKVLSNGTLRGSIVEQVDAKTVRISTNWNLSRDVLRGYTFRFLGQNQEAVVKAFDPVERLLILDAELSTFNFQFSTARRNTLNVQPRGGPLGFELTAHEEAPVLAARLVTETALGEVFPPIQMKLGSTKGTNALLEGNGAKVAFFVTKGFADLLRIGDQTRPDLFSLTTHRPEPLHTCVIEVDEQISATGEVLSPIDTESLHAQLLALQADSVAICLKNAYRNPAHEHQLATLLRQQRLPQQFRFVSVSTELSPHIKWLPRAETTVVNAYLAPVIDEYLSQIQAQIPDGTLHVMTSAGALVRADRFLPKDSLLSGPAGGVVGAAAVARRAGFTKIITFDMGGTSTDVARYDGSFEYRFETTVGQARLQSPALAIETVAAGGGSICGFDGFRLFVGPASAGSQPGPACYGAGGPLTITDVNLLLNRLDPAQFGIPVFPEQAQKRLNELLERMESSTGQRPVGTRILEGFIQIANEIMAEAVRKISVARGYDSAEYALVAFGGAGGLHACGIARLLGIRTILIPADAGLLSAVGIGEAGIERFAEATVLREFSPETWPEFNQTLVRLSAEAREAVVSESVDEEQVILKSQLAFLRFKGQESSLELNVTGIEASAEWQRVFREKYVATYGHWVDNRAVEVESLRVLAGENPSPRLLPDTGNGPEPEEVSSLKGPALLADPFSTTFIEKDFALTRTTTDGTRLIEQIAEKEHPLQQLDPQTELELFTNRFRAVAEEMGAMLQRTALSVNVKERLDFSCALLDAEGRLIANAPHIPVHLGSLGVCVRRVREAISMQPGDVVVTNHPGYGGSHLPDVTLITPVFLGV
ncbi:MAG: hydantoinase B/oxoprolinase family protein, partial [Cytophagaceae bacterium]|nr:hydantoinase B/oxoprolinase family protein [Cytophagaceae bacterium]